MTEPARQDEVVDDLANYLEETLHRMDQVITSWQVERDALAVRLAVMKAATDTAVRDAVADYEERVAQGRPYESAEDARALLNEAHSRYGN